MLTQNEKEVYLVKQVKTNYVGVDEGKLEAIVNRVVFFECERGKNALRVFVKGTSLKAQKRLFKEIPEINLSSGSQLKQYAEEWYKENLEELRVFA